MIYLGADYSRREAAEILEGMERFFSEEFLYGPAGAVHAAKLAVLGASRDEIREMMVRVIAVHRCMRKSTSFNFVSSAGNTKGCYAVIARVLFGVLRHEGHR